MTDFLVRIFIKDRDRVQDEKVRMAYGVLASIVGICCNLLLFVVKLTGGLLMGSIYQFCRGEIGRATGGRGTSVWTWAIRVYRSVDCGVFGVGSGIFLSEKFSGKSIAPGEGSF